MNKLFGLFLVIVGAQAGAFIGAVIMALLSATAATRKLEETEKAHRACIVKAFKAIYEAGGCDATDPETKGYDRGIETALDIISDVTGIDYDDVFDIDDLEEGK